MSVVNKMLRDLDNRAYANTTSAKSANYVPPSSAKGMWAAFAGLGLFCVLVATYSVYTVNRPLEPKPVQESPDHLNPQEGDQYAQAAVIAPIDYNTVAVHRDIQQKTEQNSYQNIEENTVQAFIPKPAEAVILGFASSTQSTPPEVKLTLPHTQATSGEMKVAPSDGAKSQLSSLRAKAHMASEKQNDAEVARLLQEIVVLAPQDTKTRKQLAALLFSTNRLQEAQQVLAGGIQLAPADSSMRLMQSRIFFKLGDNSSAFNVLAEHPYRALANDELVSFRAALAERMGKYDTAQQDYLLLVERNPSEAKWWLGLGVSQDKQKLHKQAINSYQQAQSLNQLPQQVDVFVAERIQLLARSS